ncbi:MAG: hypothetical protein WD876_01340 [Candidatus Pacearchaeota archaeon]
MPLKRSELLSMDYHKDVKYGLIISVLSAIVIVFAFILTWNYFSERLDNKESIPTCGGGSFYDTCNLNKPYYCDAETGKIVERASLCGCYNGMSKSGESCISQYQTGEKEISMKYILKGKEKGISFNVYEGMASYLSDLPKSINYAGGERALRSDFKLRNLNNQEQKQLLLPLLIAIENDAESKEDGVRIAISLVQNIEFGESNKTINLPGGNSLNYSRYPYEVLFDEMGVCGEKSELLAFLLKEMGYGVVFFYYQEENHEALGIKCPVRYSVDESGYCFIETTGPSIITDTGIEYVGGVKLKSKPEIILVSNGEALGTDMYEYKDAKEMMKLRDNIFVFFRETRLNRLKEKYGLVEEYNPR